MGAFCSAKNSLFRRRRKGRNGPDIWTERTAPPLAGAEVRYAGANNSLLVCGVNAGITCQVSKDGAGTWAALAYVPPSFVGNALLGQCMRQRPFSPELPAAAQDRLDGVGAHPAVGGTCQSIDKDGNFVLEIYTVAGAPQESLDWQPTGEYILSGGANVAGNLKMRGARIGGGSEEFNIPSAHTQIGQIDAFVDPLTPYPAWLAASSRGAGLVRSFFKIRRRALNDWTFREIAQPFASFDAGDFIQRGEFILSMDRANANLLRSLDYGETWTRIDLTAQNSRFHRIFRHGGRLFILAEDAPRVRVSSDGGSTWAAFTPALPSATARPQQFAVFDEERYIFCADGAGNRTYKLKTRNEI